MARAPSERRIAAAKNPLKITFRELGKRVRKICVEGGYGLMDATPTDQELVFEYNQIPLDTPPDTILTISSAFDRGVRSLLRAAGCLPAPYSAA